MRTRIQHPVAFILCLALLCTIGVVNLYSALALWGGVTQWRLLWMQLLWMGIGAVVAWGLAHYDYRRLLRSGQRWHLVILVCLVLVLFVGREISGHRSWFGIGGIGIQPSEFAKLTTVFLLAHFFTPPNRPQGYGLRDLLPIILWAGLPAGLILLQGDLGTSLFLVLLSGSYALFAKLRWRTIVLLALVGVAGAVAAYQTLSPYQQARIGTFLHPDADPRGAGYQLLQSRLAVASGGWLGKGYLQGRINKLRYLPEKHTDFIFPVLAEEWGFAGAVLSLSGFFCLLMLGLEISANAVDRYGGMLAFGIVLWLFWQLAINLGGVLGLMPLTGVTLPFFSYGGSSMVVAFIAMGLLLSIHRRRFLLDER